MIVTQKSEELLGELGKIAYEDSLVIAREDIPVGNLRPYDLSGFATGVGRKLLERFAMHAGMEYPKHSKVQIYEAILNSMEHGGGDVTVRILKSERGFACIISDEGAGFDTVNPRRQRGGMVSYRGFGGKVSFNDAGNSVTIQYLF